MSNIFTKERTKEVLTNLLNCYSGEAFAWVIEDDTDTDVWVNDFLDSIIDDFVKYANKNKQMVYSVVGGHDDGTLASALEHEIFYEEAVLIYSECEEAIGSNVDIYNTKEVWLIGTGEVEVVTKIHLFVDGWDFIYRFSTGTIVEGEKTPCPLEDLLDYLVTVSEVDAKDGDNGENQKG